MPEPFPDVSIDPDDLIMRATHMSDENLEPPPAFRGPIERQERNVGNGLNGIAASLNPAAWMQRWGLPGFVSCLLAMCVSALLWDRYEDRLSHERNIDAVIAATREMHSTDVEERRADRDRTLQLTREITQLAKAVERIEVRVEEIHQQRDRPRNNREQAPTPKTAGLLE